MVFQKHVYGPDNSFSNISRPHGKIQVHSVPVVVTRQEIKEAYMSRIQMTKLRRNWYHLLAVT